MANKKVAVVLAGCGHLDGSEIREAVISLLALDRAGADFQCCAPDKPQMHVVNHLRREPVAGQSRNVLEEAARIARGNIVPLSAVHAADYDAILLPGGFGAAKNLSDFAFSGADCTVNPDVARVVRAVHAAGKPVGAICIAPVILARLLGSEKPRLTIGTDPGTAAAIGKMGGEHVSCGGGGAVVDAHLRLVSTPAYMLDSPISEVWAGIEKLVAELLAMTA